MLTIKTVRRTLLAITATAALITAVATAAPANPVGFSKLPAGSALRMTSAASAPADEMVSRLMIKPRVQAGGKLARALDTRDASSLSHTANVPLAVVRPMSGGAHVVKLDQPVTLLEARVIAERLMHNDYSVELAEPDRMMYPTTAPSAGTNPGYASQWHYFAPEGANKGGANLPAAWDRTYGSTSIKVAVLDTGYRQHADLGAVLPGYDFITDVTIANDGDGRDNDAQDPGDWVLAGECGSSPARNSSWHGTHVAGTIAALRDNSTGGTGVASSIKILPVRVLGKCGGYESDLIDGMRWAAGLTVAGVPANANPAQVLNMSLGGVGSCSSGFMQPAVNAIVSAGKVIVAASGNNSSTAVGWPANCAGVIAVTAHAIDGDNAGYADIGPEVAISGPGGGCGTQSGSGATAACTTYISVNGSGVYSTFNSGEKGPTGNNYANYQGTSMATPHVAGVVALMLSVDSALTPAEIKSYLQSSARAHPAGTTCTLGTEIGKCGSGLLDAERALSAVIAAAPTANITNLTAVVASGTNVSLTGSATSGANRTISSYAWTQVSGPSAAVIDNSNAASATFTASTSGSYVFRLSVTDNGGQSGFVNSSVVRVNSLPVLTAETPKTVMVGDPLAFTMAATDADGDAVIFHSVSLPAGATLSAAGAFNWPSTTPVGDTAMTYYGSDNDGNSTTGTVNITVAPVPVAAGSGGGGSLDGESLIGLALLAACLRLRRKFASA